MADYDNTNTGVLFTNRKKTSNKAPDLKGSVNVNGKEFWLSGWFTFKKSDGEKYISLRLEEKEEIPVNQRANNVNDDPFSGMGGTTNKQLSMFDNSDDDDEIPF